MEPTQTSSISFDIPTTARNLPSANHTGFRQKVAMTFATYLAGAQAHGHIGKANHPPLQRRNYWWLDTFKIMQLAQDMNDQRKFHLRSKKPGFNPIFELMVKLFLIRLDPTTAAAIHSPHLPKQAKNPRNPNGEIDLRQDALDRPPVKQKHWTMSNEMAARTFNAWFIGHETSRNASLDLGPFNVTKNPKLNPDGLPELWAIDNRDNPQLLLTGNDKIMLMSRAPYRHLEIQKLMVKMFNLRYNHTQLLA